jgi:hypothetical protein
MHQPLFIHSNTDFSTKIRTEAGPHALVTSSMLQALRWITNPDVMISGIYLNPNDSSYSALRFLELTLLQRPVTPIFLLDEEHEISTPAQKHFFEHVSVKGFFSGKESFTQLIGALAPNENASLNEIKKRITTRSEHPGYLAVPIVDFVHSKTYPFDVFVEDEKKQLRLFATAGSSIESEYLSHVSSKTSWMFV